ncbi:MAG: Rieske 2Fe-2S domain-containing protein [Nitrospira sp.]|nr:Rieske 2Fe-2S domain-containing protein [Nitrospira sp.]MDH4369995.1 Rieske 2Fe-2S domain-containing protein [Nitrospira sp.]MDH5348517.1 Rieske 2Fe-2S domain-containing protein [Nitrospira sp.]MDH5499379.1 Rieske 2Fe-2S domain-containing protein [Nitrospira sp.]MDH5726632.1 Rieske 2Fe-2S domain-containing protein [Nitrospira sp.]
MPEFVRVAALAEINPGHGIVAEANGKTLAVFNVDGTIHAINNTCCHRDGPLGEGELDGDIVTCPWHGWRYNVTNGACMNNPSAKVEAYQVRIDGDDIKVLL